MDILDTVIGFISGTIMPFVLEWWKEQRRAKRERSRELEQLSKSGGADALKFQKLLMEASGLFTDTQSDAVLRERWQELMKRAANESGIAIETFQTDLDAFIKADKAPQEYFARVLTAFMKRDFDEAANIAAGWVKHVEERAGQNNLSKGESPEKIHDSLYQAYRQLTLALTASGKYGEALDACRKALVKFPRLEEPARWAELQFLLGNTTDGWEAVGAYLSALTVWAHEISPASQRETRKPAQKEQSQRWALLHCKLADAWCDAADQSGGYTKAHCIVEAETVLRTAQSTFILKDSDWAEAQLILCRALCLRAETCPYNEKARLLTEVLNAYQEAITVYTRKHHPLKWAWIQKNMGDVLHDQAETTTGENRARLLDDARKTYSAALDVFPPKTRNWALTLRNMGIVLCNQAETATEENRARLLDDAGKAYRAALDVLPPKTHNWAVTLMNMGKVWRRQAEVATGENHAGLLDDAANAYRAALDVFPPETHDWAGTQMDMGYVLCDQAKTATGENRARLLDDAGKAYSAALDVFLPETRNWASTQMNMGNVLYYQAKTTTGENRARLLDDAGKAYRAALDVFPPETHDWASAQMNMGSILYNQAEAATGENRARLLDDAGKAYRVALDVFPPETHQWASVQMGMGNVLSDQAETATGENRTRLLDDAGKAYRAALDVFPPETHDWALVQICMGSALSDQAETATGENRARLLDNAEKTYRAALDVFTPEAAPYYHTMVLENLEIAMRLRTEIAEEENREPLPNEEPVASDTPSEGYLSSSHPQEG